MTRIVRTKTFLRWNPAVRSVKSVAKLRALFVAAGMFLLTA